MYDVEIRKPGFITEIIRGVQIFDTIDSVLPINMTPNYSSEELVHTTYVSPNELHSSTPRDQEGPPPEEETRMDYSYITEIDLSLPRETRTLNEVIVPDYITVHLGTPTSSARNVRVRFIDYIKNVVSSEIYPTWPNNSLRANIHAIITFALNRIYTEWYRSRGNNFDITNSTRYDMAFVENRNIFQNISNIVDEVFNVYARRMGFRDPYFTEFCNGTTVTCSGMSQWGTV
ncbi:MAG: SpoIID/LytB domain-containing protein [Oscillospiraceae bacterium]|nr:SpoIID/LytB domain-containing protein [Oscillospiraceae bacterium]